MEKNFYIYAARQIVMLFFYIPMNKMWWNDLKKKKFPQYITNWSDSMKFPACLRRRTLYLYKRAVKVRVKENNCNDESAQEHHNIQREYSGGSSFAATTTDARPGRIC